MTPTPAPLSGAPARLILEGREMEVPVALATAGHNGLVAAELRGKLDIVSYDPGFMNTASTASAITFIDGEQGQLWYRGYPIEQLAEHSTFLEVAYLLIYGELPTEAVLADFSERVNRHTLIPEQFRGFLASFPRGGHPMSMLASAMNALATFYPEALNPHDPDAVDAATVLILAKMRTITSYIHRSLKGESLMYPDYARGYVEDLLRMTFGAPYDPWSENPVISSAMDKLLILHADHEQNCSTSTVRLVGSANANLFASVAAGINALSGPLHGGANEAVLNMLERIHSGGETVSQFMTRVKDRSDTERLMGFGHRVYKAYDPRAAIVKDHAHAVLDALNVDDPLLDIAMGLEEIALNDEYFISRRLYPNVDFYTGLIYRAMGYGPEMFTPLFALGRMPGWIAQWREMLLDPATRIGRPHQIYTGPLARDYVPVSER